MSRKAAAILAALLAALPAGVSGEDPSGTRPIHATTRQAFQALPSLLPKDTRLLHDPAAIEKFLEALDDSPPA